MLRSALAVLAVLLCSVVAAEVPVPSLRSPVTDLTNTLTPAQAAQLEQQLRAFEAQKGSQVAVLIVPTTQPESIEQYSIRVAENWKLGRHGVNDGVLLLVAKDDHAVRIEVGYGLEGALPDVFASRIARQVIVPRFRDGDFYGGISQGIERIIGIIEGEPLPEAAHGESSAARGIGAALPLLLMFVFVASTILRRLFGSFGGATLTAGVASLLVWLLTSALAVSIGAGVLAFLFTLLTGGGGGGGWTSSRGLGRGMGGYWGGGGLGGPFGGRGGFGGGGGWSGGGGSFGGGGASGRW